MAAIDAGAEDVREDGDKLRVLCEPDRPDRGPRARCEEAGVEIESAGPDDGAEKHGRGRRAPTPSGCSKLLDALDDHDDVNEVHANFDIPESRSSEKLAAGLAIATRSQSGRHPTPSQNQSLCRS